MKESERVQINVVYHLIAELFKIGINAYIWHISLYGTIYIRFEDRRLNSIRIGDHDGRDKLRYTFNLRSKGPIKVGWSKENNIWRYYNFLDRWKDLIREIAKRKDISAGWVVNKPYFIPNHKRDENMPKFKERYKDYITYETCCTNISQYEWNRLMNRSNHANGSKIRAMIKDQCPDMYEELALDFPNPYESSSRVSDEYYIYVHSAIEYFFKRS